MRKFFYDTEFIEYPSHIDLISIALVSESGGFFYAVNNECDFSKANPWVKENIIDHLEPQSDPSWMTREKIKSDLLNYLKPEIEDPVQLWGYYADYDHVALCWLFGPMINLPKGMPMYTLDLKQLAYHLGNPPLPTQDLPEHNAKHDALWNRRVYFYLKQIAKQKNIEV